jgi:hypothetical protein
MRNPFVRRRKNHPILKVIGGAALAAVSAWVVTMVPDIKRYIKMSRM